MSPLDLFLLLSSFVFLFLYYHHLLFAKPKAKESKGPALPPGPKGWPIIGNLPQLGPKPHQTLHSLSKTYGPLFRLRFGSVDVVVASSPGIASEFLRAHDSNFRSRPMTAGPKNLSYGNHDMVFAPYGPRWRMLRKLSAQHLLGPKALEDLRHVREKELSVLVRTLYEHAQGALAPVNHGREIHFCSTNALAQAMIGRRVFARDEAERRKAEEFRELVMRVMALAGEFVLEDFVPWLKWLDVGGVVRRMKRVHRKYDAFLDGLIEECRAVAAAEAERGSGGERKDLLSVLVGLKGEGVGDDGRVSDTDIKALLLVS